MFKILKIGLSFLFLLAFAFSVQAADFLDAVINEIAWMGTEESWQNEWIELYNNTNKTIKLDGWVLKAEDEIPNINLAGIIPANGFFILERTDDDTLPNILADQIYNGALENAGENLELYDNLGNLIDSVDCSSEWPAGDNKTKQTMERKNPIAPGNHFDNWTTSQNPGGTPKAKNSSGREVPSEPKTQPESQPEQESVVYPSNIFINEILPSPEGPDAEEEWIEIFNKNDFEVDLSDWEIKDAVGRTKTYVFPKGTKISVKGFLVLKRPITKITLNNNGDGVLFIQPDGKIIDEVSYEKAFHDQSYNRVESGWVWDNNLTPGSPNIIPAPVLKAEKETQEGKNQESTSEKELAAISEQIPKKISSPIPLLIASGVAIFSGTIILILKRKLSQKIVN